MYFKIGRNSHWRYSVKKGILRNFAKFIGKHLCRVFFYNKVAGLKYLPVNFVKLLRTPFLRNTSGRLTLIRWKFLNVRKRHLCLSLFSIKLRTWRPAFLLKKVFSGEYCKIFKNSLLVGTFCSLYFYVMIEFFGRLWVQNWRLWYFLYYCCFPS